MLSGQVLGRRAAEGRARGLRSAWAGPSVWVARWAARRHGRGVPRPGTGTAPETGRSPIRLTVRTTPTPGPPESMLPFSTLTPARGRRVPHYSQVRPAAGPLGTRPNTVLSLLGPGGGLSRTWPAGPRPRRPRQARQSISQSLPES